jgi:hypothetical protein
MTVRLRIRRFREVDGLGIVRRLGYASDPGVLPKPALGCKWQQELGFEEVRALRQDPSLREVFQTVRRHGFATVER